MIPKELLPPDLMGSAFIAGGYAACPALASDLDVWVHVNPEREPLAEARERILVWLETEMWPYEAEESNHRTDGIDRQGYPVTSQRVAIIRSPHWSHPVQIMVTTAGPAELLETFDVSTHQVALVFGNVIKGSGWTPVTEPPRMLNNLISPALTATRMEKIAARFGHSLTAQGTR